jgi:hypothetical protein
MCAGARAPPAVHTLFETLMDWDSFSVRVAEGMLHAIPEILLSIPEVRG